RPVCHQLFTFAERHHSGALAVGLSLVEKRVSAELLPTRPHYPHVSTFGLLTSTDRRLGDGSQITRVLVADRDELYGNWTHFARVCIEFPMDPGQRRINRIGLRHLSPRILPNRAHGRGTPARLCPVALPGRR